MYTLRMSFYENSVTFHNLSLVQAFRKIQSMRAWSKFVITRKHDESMAFEWDDGGIFHYSQPRKKLP